MLSKTILAALFMYQFSVLSFGNSAPLKVGDIVIEQRWARMVSDMPGAIDVYLAIRNTSQFDELLYAVAAQGGSQAFLHESIEGKTDPEPLPGGVVLEATTQLVMRKNGIHIVVAGLKGAVAPGSKLDLIVLFRDAGELEIDVPVLEDSVPDPIVLRR